MSKLLFNQELYHKIATFYLINQEKDKKVTAKMLQKEFDISRELAYQYLFILNNKKSLKLYTDEELRETLAQVSRSRQGFMDKNNMLRKEIREFSRLPNALEELNKKLIDLLTKHSALIPYKQKRTVPKIQFYGGLIHYTDFHLNELINLPGINIFNFKEASKKIQKHTDISIKWFLDNDIKTVLVGITGDLLNSDRRLSEKLHMATNRTKAAFIAVELLTQALLNLAKHFEIKVLFVSGNESRVHDELSWDELLMTDNYDYSICKMTEIILRNDKRITFIPQRSYVEEPIKFAGKTLLFTHANNLTMQGNVERGAAQLIGKWSTRGTKVDMIICGHLHCTRISDMFARGASLPGANAYSDRDLQLISKSAQNSHIVSEFAIHSMKVDLDDTEGYQGYSYTENLEAYNPKSLLKTRPGRTIFEIKI